MAASIRTSAIQKEMGFVKTFGMAVACQKKGLNTHSHGYIS